VLQAGVGGLAAAVAALVRARWGDAPTLIVVEPATASPLQASIRAGRPVTSPGPVSTMGRLDCKSPSHLALGELARSADLFATVTDAEVAEKVSLVTHHGLPTTPSGAAGLAVAHHRGRRHELGLTADSRVLAILTEAAGGDGR
jgi:diaminopropionate ammonia-lyase